MSTTTTNYGLVKPDLTDAADITAMNKNWDEIDKQIKNLYDTSSVLTIVDTQNELMIKKLQTEVTPIGRGGTGATTAEEALTNLGVTALLTDYAKIATGDYVGDNNYGSEVTKTLTFPFKPKMVFVTCSTHDTERHEPWIYGQTQANLGIFTLAWTENSVTWNVTKPTEHLNSSGNTYLWVAIG